MANYQNSKIYKLINSIDDQIYIGSTCQTLTTRISKHKNDAQRYPARPVYRHLNIIGLNNVSIILIEFYPCINKLELEQRERHHIGLLKPQLNSYIPTRTRKQYYIDNADTHKQQMKQYYIDNKDKAKQYYIDNAETI